MKNMVLRYKKSPDHLFYVGFTPEDFMLLLTVRIPFSRSDFFNDLARCEKSPCNTVICAIFVLLQNFLGTIKNLADFD
jgi:hypothetical protein